MEMDKKEIDIVRRAIEPGNLLVNRETMVRMMGVKFWYRNIVEKILRIHELAHEVGNKKDAKIDIE